MIVVACGLRAPQHPSEAGAAVEARFKTVLLARQMAAIFQFSPLPLFLLAVAQLLLPVPQPQSVVVRLVLLPAGLTLMKLDALQGLMLKAHKCRSRAPGAGREPLQTLATEALPFRCHSCLLRRRARLVILEPPSTMMRLQWAAPRIQREETCPHRPLPLCAHHRWRWNSVLQLGAACGALVVDREVQKQMACKQ